MQMEMSTGRGSWTTGRTGGDGRISKAALPVVGTIGLGAVALTRRTLLGKLLFGASAVLLGKRAVEAVRDLRSARAGHGVLIDESVHIERTPRDVYGFFRDFEKLPAFMRHTHDVREDEDGRIHWAARLSNGLGLEWDALIVDDKPGELISWRSSPEEPFEETGTVRFLAADGGTTVMLRVAYDFSWTPAGLMIAKATEDWTAEMIADELASLKRILESQPTREPDVAASAVLQPEPV